MHEKYYMTKKAKKIFSARWLTTLIALMLLATGCNLGDEGVTSGIEITQESVVESQTDAGPSSVALTTLIENGTAKFIIISRDSEYSNAAKTLQTLLTGKFGVMVPMRNYELDTDPSMKIYVGGNYNEVAESQPPALYNAYGVYCKDDDIYLLGDTATAVLQCVNNFSSRIKADTVVKGENGKVNCSVDLNSIVFLVNPDVKFTSPKLLGSAIHEYRIVIPKNADALTRYLAKAWKEGILEDTGYVIDVVTDDAAPAEKEIVLGKTTRSGNQAFYQSEKDLGDYEIKSVGSSLYVSYTSSFGLSEPDRLFRKELYADDSPSTVSESGRAAYDYHIERENADDVRVMTSNVLVAGWGGETDTPDVVELRMELMAEVYNTFMPDFIGLQECTSVNRSGLREHLDDAYAWINFPSTSASAYMTIIYRSDLWRLQTYDTGVEKPEKHPWGFVWAKFARVDDPSKTFIVFSTHWAASDLQYPGFRMDIATEINAKLKEFAMLYPNTPVAITGDQNGGRDDSAFAAMIDGFAMESAYYGAADTNLTLIESVIDHIVIDTTKTAVICMRKLNYFTTDFASDHYSYFADLQLK